MSGAILGVAAMIGGLLAREKLSTLSVDNLAEKFSGTTNFPCFLPPSSICPNFRRHCKVLKRKERFMRDRQIPDKPRKFVTGS
jgi:hypothetical protein